MINRCISGGERIGNYRIIEEIARGGYGRVYLGEHAILTERTVAIKLLHSKYLNVKKERDRFLQEARFLEKLKHPHILPIVDVGLHKGSLYIVTEYTPKGSLQDLLERRFPQPLTVEEALTILTQVGQGLYFAHLQNIVHCDLKPANILFNIQGEAVIADFGIAAVMAEESSRSATAVAGTLAYMAPERFQGEVSTAIDLYSLGCIAYQLFTGRLPFHTLDDSALRYKHFYENPISPTRLNPQLPQYIELAVLKAMAKEPTERYRDVASFIAALHSPPTRVMTSEAPRKRKEQLLDAGNYNFVLRRYQEALIAYNQAIELDPNLAAAYNGRGNVLYRLRRYGGALAAYNQAIELDPNLAAAYNGRGNVLYRLRRYEEALAAYKRAHRIDPGFTGAFFNQSLAIERLEQQRRFHRSAFHRR
jgi:serine/threonine protein kinase